MSSKDKEIKIKFPKTMGTCIDQLFKLEEEKKALSRDFSKKETVLKGKIAAYEAHLVSEFGKKKINGAKGKFAKMEVKKQDLPTVKDWSKFYSYIKENNAFDLLQKRVSTAAWNERIEDGKTIPGVETFKKTKISLTKA